MTRQERLKQVKTISLGVCLLLLTLILSVLMLVNIVRVSKDTDRIYESPYHNSSEYRVLSQNLADTRLRMQRLLAFRSEADINRTRTEVQELYEKIKQNLKNICQNYLGQSEELTRLKDLILKDFFGAQQEALNAAGEIADNQQMYEYFADRTLPLYDQVADQLAVCIDEESRQVTALLLKANRTTVSNIVFSSVTTALLLGFLAWYLYKTPRASRANYYRENLLGLISANCGELLLIYDRQKHRPVYATENIGRLLGIESREALAKPELIRKCFQDEQLVELVNNFAESGYGEAVEADCRISNTKTGGEWQARVRLFPQYRDEKNWIVLAMTDITAELNCRQVLKDALETAEDAGRVKNSFIAKINGGFRTPLNTAVGMAALALREDLPPRAREYLEAIADSARQLLKLTDNVLDMADLEAGKLTVSSETFRMSVFLTSFKEEFAKAGEEFGVSFSCTTEGLTQDRLRGDTMRLWQILGNLASNAVRFNHAGGEAALHVTQLFEREGKVRLRFIVTDTGMGMSREFLTRLFEPFENENRAETADKRGSGLGLAIVKNLVTLLGGSIRAESEQGVGSAFTVDLDFALPPPDTVTIAGAGGEELLVDLDRETVLDLSGRRVLAAFASKAEGTVVVDYLKDRRADAELVTGGEEAVSRYLASPPGTYDALVMDGELAPLDCCGVAQRVRNSGRSDAGTIVVLAILDGNYPADKEKALASGVDEIIAKPLDLRNLYRALKFFFGGGGADQ